MTTGDTNPSRPDFTRLVENAEREQRTRVDAVERAGRLAVPRAAADIRIRIVLVGIVLLVLVWGPQLRDVMRDESARVYATQEALDALDAWSDGESAE